MSPSDKPVSPLDWAYVVKPACVAGHKQIIDAETLAITNRNNRITVCSNAISSWTESIETLTIQLDEKAEQRAKIVAFLESLQETKSEYEETDRLLTRLYTTLFASNARLLREILSYLEKTEADLAAHAAELRAELAKISDTAARFDMELRIEKVELIRAFRRSAPAEVPLMTFILAELDKPESESAIQPEDEVLLRTIACAEKDADLTLALLNSERTRNAKLLAVYDVKVIAKKAELEEHDDIIKGKNDEVAKLRHDISIIQQEIAQLHKDNQGSGTRIAQEQALMNDNQHCWEWVPR